MIFHFAAICNEFPPEHIISIAAHPRSNIRGRNKIIHNTCLANKIEWIINIWIEFNSLFVVRVFFMF